MWLNHIWDSIHDLLWRYQVVDKETTGPSSVSTNVVFVNNASIMIHCFKIFERKEIATKDY